MCSTQMSPLFTLFHCLSPTTYTFLLHNHIPFLLAVQNTDKSQGSWELFSFSQEVEPGQGCGRGKSYMIGFSKAGE